MSVDPQEDPASQPPNASATTTFVIRTDDQTSARMSLNVSCDGAVATCSAPAWVYASSSSPATVTVSYTTGSGIASGTITLEATDELTQEIQQGMMTVNIASAPPRVGISGANPQYTAENVSTNYPSFTVTNTGFTAAQYTLTANCSGNIGWNAWNSPSCGSTWTSASVSPGATITVTVYYSTNAAANGSGTLTLTARSPFPADTSRSAQVTVVPLSEAVAVSAPSGTPQVNRAPGTPLTFTVQETGNSSSGFRYKLTASCTGAAVGCTFAATGSDTTSLPPAPGVNQTATVNAVGTSDLAGGSGTVKVVASYTNDWGQLYSGTATANVTVPDIRTYFAAISPVSSTTATEANIPTSGSFTVTDSGNTQATYTLTIPTCTGTTGGCSFSSSSSITQESVVVAGNRGTVTVPIYFTTGTTGQNITVTLHAVGINTSASGTITVVPQAPTVQLSGPAPITVATNGSANLRFVVRNVGSAGTVTYTLQTSGCVSPITSCGSLSPVQIAQGDSAVVSVPVQTDASTGQAHVTLQATAPRPPWVNLYQAQATATVNTYDPTALVLSSLDAGPVMNRGLCLTVSAGNGAAYECGDLRLVHALPTTRTMNAVRTPVLIYSSQQAAPHPIVTAAATLPFETTSADVVTATLTGSTNQVYATSQWPAWTGGTSKRIALSFDASSYATGAYPYTLTVSTTHSGIVATKSITGTLLIVNRAPTSAGDAPFGAGWWIAGFEELPMVHPDSLMWVGGDGSARLYTRPIGSATAVPYRAVNVDRPDSITFDNTYYTRWAAHRLQVRFSTIGKHVQTVNRLGHVTTFNYTAGGVKLQSIALPPSAAGLQYVFSYPSNIFSGVSAPGNRQVSVSVVGGLLQSITDPDTKVVQFGYSGSDPRVRTRTDRLNTQTSFNYDGASRLASVDIPLASGAPIHTSFRSAEATPIDSGPSDSAAVYTFVNGPRVDTTYTKFWLNRFGQPDVIKNAVGDSTIITRDDQWPALAKKVVDPTGYTVTALYDGHGNLQHLINHNPLGDNVDPQTDYSWDGTWDFVTQQTFAAGEVVSFSYDPTTGNRLYEQPGTDTTRRVRFGYDPTTKLLTSSTIAGVSESFTYDPTLYDLSATVSPRGFRTQLDRDAIGRLTIVHAPIDSLQQVMSLDSTQYDLAGRVVRHAVAAPAYGIRAKAGEMIDSTVYDAEGNTVAVLRWQSPDPTNIGVVKDSTVYDAAGRPVRHVAPDSQHDSTEYDAAGNVVAYISRRNLTITSTYDALNRLKTRTTPSVQYPAVNETWISGRSWAMDTSPFPEYSLSSESTIGLLPGDVDKYEYDQVGRLTSAENGDAKVHRGYFPGGALKADTLMIRNVRDKTFGHTYVTSFGYDRDGRRTLVRHPSNLAPQSAGVPLTDVQYGYDPATGVLATVTDMFNNVTRYTDDARGRLTTLVLPGKLTEQFGYDDDGQLRGDTVTSSSTIVGDTAQKYNVLRATTLTYDGRGKVLKAGNGASQQDTLQSFFNGLGQVDSTHYHGGYVQTSYVGTNSQWTSFTTDEGMRVDAFGNKYGSTTASERGLWYGPAGGNTTWTGTSDSVEYTNGTGRVSRLRTNLREHDVYSATYPLKADGEAFDESGNLERRALLATSGMAVQNIRYEYYDAAERLRAVDDRFTWHPSAADGYTRSTFEEYRYDALGRRIWTRSQSACATASTSACKPIDMLSDVRRIVWDGTQELYEIRHPGADTLTSAALENDVAPDTAVLAYTYEAGATGRQDLSAYFGRVAYVLGRTLDEPVEVIRLNYGSRANVSDADIGKYFGYNSLVWSPVWSWRGIADNGALASGPAGDTATSTAGTATSRRTVSGTNYYVTPPWNDLYTSWGAGYITGHGWSGGLLDDRADRVGQRYKRARYYDPETGHFTQEDPIGLAGGLNAYGFVGGDPVNYTDPFGLRGCDWGDTSKCSLLDLVLEIGTVGLGTEMGNVGKAKFEFAPFGTISRTIKLQSDGLSLQPTEYEGGMKVKATAGVGPVEVSASGSVKANPRTGTVRASGSVSVGGKHAGVNSAGGVSGTWGIFKGTVNPHWSDIYTYVTEPIFEWARPGLDKIAHPWQ